MSREPQAWTQEPWSVRFVQRSDGGGFWVIEGENKTRGVDVAHGATAKRIVACVNALAGREPGALAELEGVLSEVAMHYENLCGCQPPAHSPKCLWCCIRAALARFRREWDNENDVVVIS